MTIIGTIKGIIQGTIKGTLAVIYNDPLFTKWRVRLTNKEE